MSNPIVIKRRDYGVHTPPPDVSGLRIFESSAKLRIIAYLAEGPRSLMDVYSYFSNNYALRVKIGGLIEIGVVEYVSIGTRRYLQLTEYGQRLSAPVMEMLAVIREKEEPLEE